jgi:hypothetical protein
MLAAAKNSETVRRRKRRRFVTPRPDVTLSHLVKSKKNWLKVTKKVHEKEGMKDLSTEILLRYVRS